jgi:replicative DNA helicase
MDQMINSTKQNNSRPPSVAELPHDLLSERALLGCLMIDGEIFDEIVDLTILREDFYHPQYGLIYDAIKDLSNSRKPIDYVTVCAQLADLGKLEEIGGQTFILDLIENQASGVNLRQYATNVKDKSSLRKIIRTARKVAEAGMTHTGSVKDFISEVEASFFKLTNESKTAGMLKLNSCLKQNLKDLEDTSRKPGEISGLTTGYKKLDELVLGMQPGQLIILAARPAMGKTSLALNLALNSCEATGLPVAVFSLEMTASELSMKLLTGKAKVDSRRIKRKEFLDTDLRSIASSVKTLNNLPILINDNGSISLHDIQSYCRKIKSEQGLGLVVIDYLQLMSGNSHVQREQQIAEISRGLKNLAKELGCPILCLSQLNRGVEARPNKRPLVSDLRESGSIEQDADIVMLVYRDEIYNENSKEKGIAEIIVGKNRGGETGTAKLAWVGAYTSFENLSYSPDSGH